MVRIKEILFPEKTSPVRIAGVRLFNFGGRIRWVNTYLKKVRDFLKL